MTSNRRLIFAGLTWLVTAAPGSLIHENKNNLPIFLGPYYYYFSYLPSIRSNKLLEILIVSALKHFKSWLYMCGSLSFRWGAIKFKACLQPCGLSVRCEAEDTPWAAYRKQIPSDSAWKKGSSSCFSLADLQFYQVNGFLGRNNDFGHVTRKL